MVEDMREKLHSLEIDVKTHNLQIDHIMTAMSSYKNDLSQQIAEVRSFVEKDNDALLDKMTIRFREEAKILADGLTKKDSEQAISIADLKSNQKWVLLLGGTLGGAVGKILNIF